jgi:hypothetical protein
MPVVAVLAALACASGYRRNLARPQMQPAQQRKDMLNAAKLMRIALSRGMADRKTPLCYAILRLKKAHAGNAAGCLCFQRAGQCTGKKARRQ